MREKDFNTGLRGVLFEAKHYAQMGSAVWLYGWLVLRQTHQSQGIGYVLGGAPVTYREIEDETGFNRRTLEAWMRVLRREGYVKTQNVPAGISVQILKAKKHRPNRSGALRNASGVYNTRQTDLFDCVKREASFAQAALRVDEGAVRDSAERGPRIEVASGANRDEINEFAWRIGSSSVERIKETIRRAAHGDLQRQTEIQNPTSQTSFPWQLPARSESANDENLPLSKSKTQIHSNGDSVSALGGVSESETRSFTPTKPATPVQHHRQLRNENPNRNDRFPWELRKRAQMIRAEREDELRRELYVGTGPEGRS
jgi:hypothetical protein